MAIAYDNASANNSGSGTVASVTVSHTVNSNTNGIAIIGGGVFNPSGTETLTSTYDGASATSILRQDDSGGFIGIEMFKKLAPPTGAKNVVLNVSLNRRLVVGVTSYTGVDQSTPHDTAVSGEALDNAPQLTVSSVANDLVVVVASKRFNTEGFTPVSVTERWEDVTTNGTAGSNVGSVGAEIAGASPNVNPQFSLTTARSWAMVGVSMNPAAVATESSEVIHSRHCISQP